MLYRLLFFLLISLTMHQAGAQSLIETLKSQYGKKEYPVIIELHDSGSIWQLNPDIHIFKYGKNAELWNVYHDVEKWDINRLASIYTLQKGIRLLKEKDSVSVWKLIDKEKDSWEKTNRVSFNKYGNKTKIWRISENFVFFEHKKDEYVFQTTKNTTIWTPDSSEITWSVGDSLFIHKLNDSTLLSINTKGARLYFSKEILTPWKISQSTTTWTINNEYELWEKRNSVELWMYDESAFSWSKNDSIPRLESNDSMYLWQLNNLVISHFQDTVRKWEPDEKIKIWNPGDTMKIWKSIPPPKTRKKISVDSIYIEKKRKPYSKKETYGSYVECWTLDDTTLFWNFGDSLETWKHLHKAKEWKINDTSSLWNIDSQNRISIINDSLTIWQLNDTSLIWEPVRKTKPTEIGDSVITWFIEDTLVAAKRKERIRLWHVFNTVHQISTDNIKNQYKLGDSVNIWHVNDSVMFWDTFDDTYVWQLDKTKKFTHIDDNIQVIRLTDKIRISIVNDSVKIWPKQDFYQLYKLNDSISILYTDINTYLWNEKGRTSIWSLKKSAKTWDITEEMKIWAIPEIQKKKDRRPVFWSFGGTGTMHFSQGFYENWKKGGESNIASLSVLNIFGNYAKKKLKWSNNAEVRLGALKPEGNDWRKNEDEIEIASKFGLRAFRHWFYTISVNAKSQAFKGLKYKEDTSWVVSNFLSPAILNFGVGMDYSPSKSLSVYISPINSKLTYVNDTALIDQTAYGLKENEKSRYEAGFQMKSQLKIDITNDILLENKLDLFSNYSDHPENIDVNWQVLLVMKISKYISSNISTHLIYDHDIKFPKTVEKNGEEITKNVPLLQFKEILSIGLSYKF
jgi:hypothetical protein